MLSGKADNFLDIRQVVELIEQRLQLLRRRHPEQGTSRLVGFIEIAVGNAAGHPHQVARRRLHPNPVKFKIQYTLLNQDELVLGRVNMDRYKLPRIAVGLESESGVCYRLREVDLSQDIPALAQITRSISGNALFKCRHGRSLPR